MAKMTMTIINAINTPRISEFIMSFVLNRVLKKEPQQMVYCGSFASTRLGSRGSEPDGRYSQIGVQSSVQNCCIKRHSHHRFVSADSSSLARLRIWHGNSRCGFDAKKNF
jgi:hypothetical protein